MSTGPRPGQLTPPDQPVEDIGGDAGRLSPDGRWNLFTDARDDLADRPDRTELTRAVVGVEAKRTRLLARWNGPKSKRGS